MQPGQAHAEACVLSDREAQVVRLLLSGLRVPLIARRLYLSPSTVRNQLSMVYRKLGVGSQQELILLFYGFWREGRTSSRPVRGRGAAATAAVMRGLPHAFVALTTGHPHGGHAIGKTITEALWF